MTTNRGPQNPDAPIVATVSVTGFFHDIVGDAMKARGVDATDVTTQYIVSLLADYAKPGTLAGEAFEKPLAFLLDEAMHTPAPGERFERLRALGDGVLYSCGFFADHFEARGVDSHYLYGIGTTAYGAASSMLRVPSEEPALNAIDIYGELAGKFATFVSVVAEVADCTIAKGAATSKGVLKIYERWLKTGSNSLAQALSSQGFVPTRGGKGVLQ